MKKLLLRSIPLSILLSRFTDSLGLCCLTEDGRFPESIRSYLLAHWEQLAPLLAPRSVTFPDFFLQDRRGWRAAIIAKRPEAEVRRRPAQLILDLKAFLQDAGRNPQDILIQPLYYLGIPHFPFAPLALLLWRAEGSILDLRASSMGQLGQSAELPQFPSHRYSRQQSQEHGQKHSQKHSGEYSKGDGSGEANREIFCLRSRPAQNSPEPQASRSHQHSPSCSYDLHGNSSPYRQGFYFDNIHREYIAPCMIEYGWERGDSSSQFYCDKGEAGCSLLFLKQEEMAGEEAAILNAIALANDMVSLHKNILAWPACRSIAGFSMNLQPGGLLRSLAYNIQPLLYRRGNSRIYIFSNNGTPSLAAGTVKGSGSHSPHPVSNSPLRITQVSLQPGDTLLLFPGALDRKKMIQAMELFSKFRKRSIFSIFSETALGRIKTELFYRNTALSREIFLIVAYPEPPADE